MVSSGSLNHVYRTVWNQALGAMVAVAEIAGSHTKSAKGEAISPTARQSPRLSAVRAALSTLAVAIAWGAMPADLLANPTGGVAIQGQATFTTNGNNLLVTTQNGAGLNHSAINWQSFSIPTGSSTYFLQPNASSTSINRVVSNNPSAIFGTLGSNGNLVLVNQSGITVGAGAVVDTAGFTAAALRMSDTDAMTGRLRFGDATVAAGAVSVQGSVLARSGDVFLLGSSVSTGSSALVQTPNGSTILGAGQQIEVTGRGLEGIVMQVQAPADSAVNLGTLKGDAVGIFAGTLKHSGLIQATTATLEGGKVVLKAAGDALVQGDSRTLAASASGKGGVIEVLGNRVGLTDNATLDASGASGGGTILVGGDYQGLNAAVQNATVSYVGPQTTLKADATSKGNGGKVIVWSDDTTRAYGSLSAQGGAGGGDGGFIETSGHRYLDVNGIRANASAPLGKAGEWLLDPNDVTIVHAVSAGLDSNLTIVGDVLSPTSDTLNTIISDTTINQTVTGTVVTINTSNTGTAGSGDIVFDAGVGGGVVISSSTNRQLNLNAARNIVFTNSDTTTFAGQGTTFSYPASTGSMTVNFNVTSGHQIVTNSNGKVTLNGNNLGTVRSLILNVPDAIHWDNFGTLQINDNATVHLGAGATLQNHAGASITLNDTTGFAFYSSANNDGIVNNDGTINVSRNTKFEAEYNQTGALNITSASLNLQNVNSISGTIDLAPTGATSIGSLNVTEKHGHTANFHDLSITKSSVTLPGTTQLNIGRSSALVDATFTNVTAPLVTLAVDVDAPSTANGSSATFLNGASSFLTLLNTSLGTFGFNNGTLGLTDTASLGISSTRFTTFSGDVGLYTAGALSIQRDITTAGNLRLISGWNGNLTTPAADTTGRGAALTVTNALTANNLNLESSDGLVLNNALTAAGTFEARARNGSIAPSSPPVQSFAVTAGGNTTLNASAGVELVNTANSFKGLSVTAGGSVNIKASGALSLGNITGSSVTLDATGAVTQPSGTINTTDTTTFSTNFGNGGSVTVYGSTVALGTVLANGVTNCADGCTNGGNGGTVFIQARSGGFSGAIQSNGGSADPTNGGNGGNAGSATIVTNGATTTLSSSAFSLTAGVGRNGTLFNGVNGTAGRWLVYASAPSAVSKGGLTSNFRHYNATYANYSGQLVTETGNGFIYASAPGALSVDVALSSGTASNVYGTTPTAVFGYTLSGFADSEDTAANIGVGGTPLFDHTFLASNDVGSYVQKYVSGLNSSLGYTFTPRNGLAYTITQAPLVTWVGGSTGLWSNAANWSALPSASNVLAVNIPAGTTVTFDVSATGTTLETLNSLGTLAISGGNLSVSKSLNSSVLSLSGGTVQGAGSFDVTNSFSQTAGSIAMTGPVSIRQASGNLVAGSISGSSILLEAVNGAVSQTAALSTTGLLKVNATNGVNLTNASNAVSSFFANNSGAGNVQLTNVGALDVTGITVAQGSVAIDNTGAYSNSGAISVTGGTLDIKTHSPLTINNSVTATGNITLAALTPDGTSNITINSAMTSSAGGISIQAYNNFIQNSGLNAALAIDVSTVAGSLQFGPGAFSVGNPVNYTVNGTTYLPPWIASTLSGGANDFVATFLDQFLAVLDEQVATVDDPLGLNQRGREGVLVEGEVCKP